jgi:flavodoxin
MAKRSIKALVVYYSKNGNTRRVALKIQEKTGAACYEIESVEDYQHGWMLYWNAIKHFVTCKHPELQGNPPNFSTYDVIFVGCPIWAAFPFRAWTIPPPLYSFLEQNRFQHTKVVPFATCDNYAGRFFEIFERNAQNAHVVEGLVFKKVQEMSTETLEERTAALLKKVGK